MKKQKGLIDILAAVALACAIGYVIATLHRGAMRRRAIYAP
jgi:hypothetical protein